MSVFNKKVAIVGSGVSGLSVAYFLRDKVEVTLYEKQDYFGGHANTVDVALESTKNIIETYGVDTGFLVFNERTYPGLIQMFEEMNVKTFPSDMSFSVQAKVDWLSRKLEWSGSNLNSVFAQRKNIFSFKFWLLLKEIIRFNELTTNYVQNVSSSNLDQNYSLNLKEYLKNNKFGKIFQEGYLLPMLGCIWSCEPETMLEFPAISLARFCHNHGLLQVQNRPQWFTVEGGSKNYVKKITDQIVDKRLNCEVVKIERFQKDGNEKVRVYTETRFEEFDAVVLATHAPQAIRVLGDPSIKELEILECIKTKQNEAILHTDQSIMPSKKIAWAAWNFENLHVSDQTRDTGVCLHYWINKLQPLPFKENLFVTLNQRRHIDESKILKRIQYAHPVLDEKAVRAQAKMAEINGHKKTWFAGAWMGYGFHEDGLQAGKLAANKIIKDLNLGVLV